MNLRKETLSNFAAFNASRILGANSPRTTPSIMEHRMSGVKSLSVMLSSLKGAGTNDLIRKT